MSELSGPLAPQRERESRNYQFWNRIDEKLRSLITLLARFCVIAGFHAAVAAAAGAFGVESADYAEQFRPQYHFSPSRHWMNDPNGMVYLDGEYHLFYQFNPAADVWGPMHWGHALSEDLLHWRHSSIALFPDAHGAIFSGSVVADVHNTSRLGTRRHPALVALFTYHDEARKTKGRSDFQSQGLAYSRDQGLSWIKYAGNPVLRNPGLRDFRDPKVSWFESQRKWVMTLVAGDRASFYSSKDLKKWRHESDFGQEWGAHGGVWECPDLLEMRVDGVTPHKYVLLVSVNPGGPNGGSATQYFVGNFDGHHFALDPDWQQRLRSTGSAAWVDYGTDDYAGVTWTNLPDGRHVFLGWMSNWNYAQKVPTRPWRGAMTVPRELKLIPTRRGLELRALPVAELDQLRTASTHLPAQTVGFVLNLTQALPANSGQLDLDLALDTMAADVTSITFCNAKGEKTVFRINRRLQRYDLDRSKSGTVDFDPGFASSQFAPIPSADTSTIMRVLLDRSSLEIFMNQGETVFTATVFPTTPYTQIILEADSPIKLKEGAVHELASVWRPE